MRKLRNKYDGIRSAKFVNKPKDIVKLDLDVIQGYYVNKNYIIDEVFKLTAKEYEMFTRMFQHNSHLLSKNSISYIGGYEILHCTMFKYGTTCILIHSENALHSTKVAKVSINELK